MIDKKLFSTFSLILADLFSLLINILIIRTLVTSWNIQTFSEWEWLCAWLGICMLIPRNGLEIVAIRSAIRHSRHLREWSAIVIISRLLLGSIAVVIFSSITILMQSTLTSQILPMALSIMASSLSPDIAARIQCRFCKFGLVYGLRSILFLILLKLSVFYFRSPSVAAWSMAGADFFMMIVWWVDAWMHHAIPGGRWRDLIRRVWKPLLQRSIEQTLTRWVRVVSWSLDAMILGLILQPLWQEVAISRRFLMTGVIAVAGWLGNIGTVLTRESIENIRFYFRTGIMMALLMSLVSASVAYCIRADWVNRLMADGKQAQVMPLFLSLNALRFAPIVVVMLSGSCLTAIRADRLVACPGILHLAGILTGISAARFFNDAEVQFCLLIAMEYLSSILVVAIVLFKMSHLNVRNGAEPYIKKNRLRIDSGLISLPTRRVLSGLEECQMEAIRGVPK